MAVSSPTRRFLIGIIPILILSITVVLQVTSAMAEAGTDTRVGSIKNSPPAQLALMTQDLTTGITPAVLANTLVGPGVTVTNVIYTGSLTASGIFSGGMGIIGFEDGIILSSGDMNDVVGPNQSDATTTEQGTPGDPDLEALPGVTTTFDAAVLELDFIPDQNEVFFQFVFASEEYNEFVNSQFNDVFAFFINGQNCALIEGDPVSINTINLGSHPELFRNNEMTIGNPIDTEADGLTVVLTCDAPVTANMTNTMKLAIADVSDRLIDSWVFLQAGSLTTEISITLGPNPGQACQGTPHTLIATIADNPQENVPVSFEIISGPNTGSLGTALTNADGIATLTYTSTGTMPIVDVAQASFVGSDGQTYVSEEVPVMWDVCEVKPTPTPSPTNCTYSQGFWKNHPEDWPMNDLILGGVKYPQEAAIEVLKTPPMGDATYILAHQLIAAKLNILNGADGTVVAITITDADTWLMDHPLGSDPADPERQVGIDLADTLDDYNEGEIGPGECDDDDLRS